MLTVGDIITSTFFPEVVKIKKCEKFGDFFIIEAIGEETNTYYERILEKDKIAKMTSREMESTKSRTDTEAVNNPTGGDITPPIV